MRPLGLLEGLTGEKTLSVIMFWQDEQGKASVEHGQEGGGSEGL